MLNIWFYNIVSPEQTVRQMGSYPMVFHFGPPCFCSRLNLFHCAILMNRAIKNIIELTNRIQRYFVVYDIINGVR